MFFDSIPTVSISSWLGSCISLFSSVLSAVWELSAFRFFAGVAVFLVAFSLLGRLVSISK